VQERITCFLYCHVFAAVAVNDKLTYAIVEVKPVSLENPESVKPKFGPGSKRIGSGLQRPQVKYLVVAADLVPTLKEKWKVDLEVKGTVLGSALEHSRYVPCP
jgi:isoleucyl-tRNA synthetase